jgi:NAD(P)H-flavin reductase
MRTLIDRPDRADPMAPVPFRVSAVARETEDTVTISLDPPDGGAFGFAPGQFDMLYAFRIGEVPISISGDPADPRVLVHTVRDVGPVTHALSAVEPGDVVGVRGPFGTDWGVDEGAGGDVVVVAGGIGLAPLRPAVYRLIAERGRFGRVVLLYGARTPAELLFPAELATWRSRFDLDVAVTVDAARPGWHGDVGFAASLIPRAAFDPERTLALVCGPEVMMRVTAQALLDRDVRPERIRISMERNMQCGVGLCGHCQFGPTLVCRDGPVFSHDRLAGWLRIREL